MSHLSIQLIGILVGALSTVFLSLSCYGEEWTDLKAGVVKITTQLGNLGAGVLVRVEPERVYIITAAHVIAGDPNPKVEFYSKPKVFATGTVLPKAQVNNFAEGLALIVVEERVNIPCGLEPLSLEAVREWDSNGQNVWLIGHSRKGIEWKKTTSLISNLQGSGISLKPGMDSGFSGAPIFIEGKLVGILIANKVGLGIGIKSKSVLEYITGLGVNPGTQEAFSSVPIFNQPLSEEKVEQQDVSPMLLVSGGEFIMGSPLGVGGDDEYPEHSVTLNKFFLDVYEVTNHQFKQFVEIHGYKTMAEKEGSGWGINSKGKWGKFPGVNWRRPVGEESVFSSGRENHPVVSISWEDARAYCMSVGKRLPTEAEWEYSARAGTTRTNWWDNDSPRSCDPMGNFADNSAKKKFEWSWAWPEYNDGFSRTAPVGKFLPNPWGLHDLSGNVREWVADWYDQDYYPNFPQESPQGPVNGRWKAIRGGSYRTNPIYLRVAARDSDHTGPHSETIGFRCAKDANN